MTIYIVTEGCYSDYHIEAVFTDKAKAEAYVDFYSKYKTYHDDYNIEEYESDLPFTFDEYQTSQFAYIVKLDKVIPMSEFIKTYHKSECWNLDWQTKADEVRKVTDVYFYSFKDYEYLFNDVYFKTSELPLMHKISIDFQKGVYFVTVHTNADVSVMEKSVHDKIAAYKEYVKDFPEGWKL